MTIAAILDFTWVIAQRSWSSSASAAAKSCWDLARPIDESTTTISCGNACSLVAAVVRHLRVESLHLFIHELNKWTYHEHKLA